MTLSAVEICNLALAEIPAKRLVSLEDNTLAAETCREQFSQAVEELMEMGEWGFAVKRATLSAVTNTRDGTWEYQWAAPSDLAFPIRVLPGSDSGFTVMQGRSLTFDFEGGTFWTQDEAVQLEYISNTPAYAAMTAMFRRGLAAVLASRIVMPITKDANRKQQLLQEAEVWRDRALARNLNANAQQQTYGDNFIPSSLRGYFGAPE